MVPLSERYTPRVQLVSDVEAFVKQVSKRKTPLLCGDNCVFIGSSRLWIRPQSVHDKSLVFDGGAGEWSALKSWCIKGLRSKLTSHH